MADALSATRATRVYVCNLMTKLGETDGFTASRFVREMQNYVGRDSLDWALVNCGDIPDEVRIAYRQEQAHPVEADIEVAGGLVPGVYAAVLGNDDVPLMHQSSRVAEAVLDIAGQGRVSGTVVRQCGEPSGLEGIEGFAALGGPGPPGRTGPSDGAGLKVTAGDRRSRVGAALRIDPGKLVITLKILSVSSSRGHYP